ncbi:hypothetical protein HYFRA_00001131 [Hymenoscyphus fraxineus]|uniref:Purine nucleoside permease n=1 Tax=Hymenoscyphus fraxineus TaxID=746836 RepID=A0A9N9PGY5_9HELO|nr:hypothetical protein HYFRA_00001131 [Hymenoscyphus fraxineus]
MYAPKICILVMFQKEVTNWLSETSPLQFIHRITLPGLSRGYETVYLTENKEVCLLVTGTALINAALSVSTLTTTPSFNFTKTYFLLSGIAGVNPKLGTIGSVALAKYAVQVDTQLEFDGREIPADWSTGYVPMGAERHSEFPRYVHGSEVYSLNGNLRDVCVGFAKGARLEDCERARGHRVLYGGAAKGVYGKAVLEPSVMKGDVASSNTFWHGKLLCEGMERVFETYTGGKAVYTMTAQEDTAILTALLRSAIQGKNDFERIVLMRSGSNFDRGWREEDKASLPYVIDEGGLEPALRNLYLAGLEVVRGILGSWERFEDGVKAEGYVGDLFGSLGGEVDFLPEGAVV